MWKVYLYASTQIFSFEMLLRISIYNGYTIVFLEILPKLVAQMFQVLMANLSWETYYHQASDY